MAILDSIRLSRISGHTFIPALLPPDAVVLDLGANKGTFSREVSRRFGWKCYAVEPNPVVCAQIEEDHLVRRLNAAASDSNSNIVLFISPNSEESSIEPVPRRNIEKQIEVNSYTLSQLMHELDLSHVDLLKVDVEGAELKLFAAASDGLLQGIRQIAIEFHELTGQTPLAEVQMLLSRFRRLGFEVIRMSFTHYADVLCINRSLCKARWSQMVGIRYVSKNIRAVHRASRWLLPT